MLLAQQPYYIIGNLLLYWLHYIYFKFLLLAVITLLAVNTLLVVSR